jgi:hypothetical protein
MRRHRKGKVERAMKEEVYGCSRMIQRRGFQTAVKVLLRRRRERGASSAQLVRFILN